MPFPHSFPFKFFPFGELLSCHEKKSQCNNLIVSQRLLFLKENSASRCHQIINFLLINSSNSFRFTNFWCQHREQMDNSVPEAFFRFCLYRYCYTQPLLLSLRSSSDELVFFHIPYKLSFPRDRSRSLKYEMFPHQPISCAILSAAYLQAAAMRHFGCGQARPVGVMACCPQLLYNL